MTSDRRKLPRRTVHTKAIVVGNDGLTRLSAYVIDQSTAGVRVRLLEEHSIPCDCYILFANCIEPCRVAWQSSRTAGLAFTASGWAVIEPSQP